MAGAALRITSLLLAARRAARPQPRDRTEDSITDGKKAEEVEVDLVRATDPMESLD